MRSLDYTRTKTDGASEPITKAELKNYLKENYGTDATEDTLIEDMIEAARVWVEDETRMAVVNQTVVAQIDDDEENIIEWVPPFQPIQSVTSIKRIDYEGTETTLTENDNYYEIGLSGGTNIRWRFARFFSTIPAGGLSYYPVKATYVAGYSSVPKDIKLAVMKLAAENYVNRESSVDWSVESVPYDVATTINHYKQYGA